MSDAVPSAAALRRLSRRGALKAAGGALIIAGGAAALARGPRRADGLPAAIDLSTARALGDGFFLVDGWILTAEDMQALTASAKAARL